ncbi:C40 family peptidase, partial [Blautia pseudococcoides]|nr:C40 family peptidase [Blautia pseudococcoides]
NKESGPVLNEPDSSAGPESTDTSENTEISDTDTSPDTKEHNTSESGRISGEDVVNYALQFVGRRYVWGGESLTDGVDCSGFTMKVYEHFGISLPHYTGDQEQCGRGVSYAEAQPGDLILYSGHVAIYMGGGQIVHAANSQPYPKGGIKVSDNAAYMPIVAVRRLIG